MSVIAKIFNRLLFRLRETLEHNTKECLIINNIQLEKVEDNKFGYLGVWMSSSKN